MPRSPFAPRTFLGVLALAAGTALAASANSAQWGYEGHAGPENWGQLDPAFAACAKGVQQSPVDITGAVAAKLPPLSIQWAEEADWTLTNNGHTIQASSNDAGRLMIGNKAFTLLQFHFHHPSEHAIDGKRAPMEVHFVHRAEDGGLAVIGVMLIGGGAPGPLDWLMKAAPTEEGTAPGGYIDPRALMPEDTQYWRYQGSLTTPPCSEIVSWTVMKTPVQVSDAAIEAFKKLIPADARPLQPLNRRYLLTQ